MELFPKKTRLHKAMFHVFAISASWLLACSSGGSGSGSSSAAASSPASTASTTQSSTAAASSSASAAPAQAEVNVEDILKSDDANSEGIVDTDVSKVPDEGAVGLADMKPPPPKAEWLPVGNLAIMNPGWDKQKISNNMGMLYSKELHAGVAFSAFGAKDDGPKTVQQMVKTLGFTDVKWSKKGKPVKLGEDKSVPALLFFGQGKSSKGDPLNLFFSVMKTGQPMNLIALGGARKESGADAYKATLAIVALAKRVK